MNLELTEQEKREIQQKIERQAQRHQQRVEWRGYGAEQDRRGKA